MLRKSNQGMPLAQAETSIRCTKFAGERTREPMTVEQFGTKIDELAACSPKRLVEDLRLKPDRADVILPASEIC